jgi:hypothetical protein
MSQGYQLAPAGAQLTFPPEISQLAASYGLGQPQAQYDHAGQGCLRMVIAASLSLLLLMAALLFLVFAQLPASPFASFPVPVLFIMPLLVILAFLLVGFSLRRSRAYACPGGFIEVRGTRVVRVIRWDQIQQVWKERTRISGSPGHPGGSVCRYFIRDEQGRTWATDFLPIWKRANYEHARREFAQAAPHMLADFHAGRYLLFGQVSVDQHGVSVPGSLTSRSQSYQLPLPTIVKASLGQRLTFELAAAGGLQMVSVQVPEQATCLLLLLATLSQGRIICEYDDWLRA